MAYYGNFEFALLPPLIDQLVRFIDGLEAAELSEANVARVGEGEENAQGVYLLYHWSELAYIGKTDAQNGLRTRLARHRHNIAHRVGLDPSDVRFKAVRVAVFTALDLETALLGREDLGSHPWNGSGFGANDPGRERDTTKAEAGHFDFEFPIDVDVPLEGLTRGSPVPIAQAANELKELLPYTFRATRGSGRRAHEDFEGRTITLPATGTVTARKIVELIVAALPSGWQFTRLAGRLIAYRETKDDYPSAIEWWRSPGGRTPLHRSVRDV